MRSNKGPEIFDWHSCAHFDAREHARAASFVQVAVLAGEALP
jgi:hypothetical protein